MPFKSLAQLRYMFAKKPELAKEFAEKTPNIKSLPKKVAKKKAAKKVTRKNASKKKKS